MYVPSPLLFPFIPYLVYQYTNILCILDYDWDDVSVRRGLFLDLASEKEFDPFKADNWYQITKAELIKKKVFFLFLSPFFTLIITLLIMFSFSSSFSFSLPLLFLVLLGKGRSSSVELLRWKSSQSFDCTFP